MAIQQPGGTIVNYTFTDAATRADLVSKLETQLGTAGWSTISGGGSSDVLMKSAVTADGLSARLRLLDPGSGNCAQFTLKDNAGALTSQIFYLLPGSFDWRIIANKFWFAMFRRGAAQRIASRAVLLGGTIWVTPEVLSLMGSDLDCGHLQGTGTSDTTGNTASWRSTMEPIGSAASRDSTLWRGWMVNYTDDSEGLTRLELPGRPFSTTSQQTPKWDTAQDRRTMLEARVSWSSTSVNTGEPKWKGQLWGGMMLSGVADSESTITFDGHTFMAITDQCDNTAAGRATLYVAVD